MTLPLTRDETASAGGVVSSTLLNDLQDCIIGGKHGAIQKNLGPAFGFSYGSPLWTRDSTLADDAPWKATDNAALYVEIPLLVGERITAVNLHVKDFDATRYIQGQLFLRAKTGGSATAKSTLVSSAKSGVNHSFALTGITPQAALAGEVWLLAVACIAAGGGNRVFYSCDVTIDKP